jgi:predicted enzyme related to lactoylglutathione lyase
VWLIYITVADLDEAMRRCQERGGKVRVPAKDMGGQGRYAIIEDPAGAVAALFEPSGK